MAAAIFGNARGPAMMNWLVANCDLFGLPFQNWMLLVGGGLLLYLAVLAVVRPRRTRAR